MKLPSTVSVHPANLRNAHLVLLEIVILGCVCVRQDWCSRHYRSLRDHKGNFQERDESFRIRRINGIDEAWRNRVVQRAQSNERWYKYPLGTPDAFPRRIAAI